MKKILFILLFSLGIASCVKDEMFKGPAHIENILIEPNNITSKDKVKITALITDLIGIQMVKLDYKTIDKSETITMHLVDNNLYSALIPSQENNTQVQFTISVTNKNGFLTTSKTQKYTVTDQLIDYSQIVMNEIDGNSKSIELFNKGKESFSLEGFTLLKNNSSEWWKGTTESGIIEPGQYIVIIQNNPDNQNLSGTSGISSKQALKIEFKSPNGNNIGTFLRGTDDNLGAKLSDTAPYSYQICPNGEGEWKLAIPTIGNKNPKTGENIPQN
ncbi:lamin tail domain-containing protein [Myroides phaeus]|uniref:lamin tail domain-containing protein n=1 Tax=Myroides phaeus TaxID=702745 RepID=UPI001303CF6F|nr:lamin tail domain-containing protein [Myroides phaeus]